MGIKCSLFGHAYGETTVERDREEQGSEVVITIREIETCERCGETRVVSENKEVTTVETPDDVSLSEAGAESEDDTDPEDSTDGTAIVDAEAGEPVSASEDDEADVTDEQPPVEPPSAAEDDGIILEDDSEPESDRDPGEWPDDEAATETESTAQPDADPAVAVTDDDPSSVEPTDAVDQPPAESDERDDSEVWSETDPDLDAERTGPDVTTAPDGQFRCSECGFTTPVASSSLREGDFCPECHQGTLVQESG